MGRSLWDTPSGRDRRWAKRSGGYTSAPRYVRIFVTLLAVTLVGTLAWQGIQALLHPASKNSDSRMAGNAGYDVRGSAAAAGGATEIDGAASAAWESDVANALQSAAAQGSAGNVTAAEVEVDRAASIVMAARVQAQKAPQQFYAAGLAALDRVLRTQPDNSRLLEHVTQARIELADLRSSESGNTDANRAAQSPDAPEMNTYPGAAATPIDEDGATGALAHHAASAPGHVVIASPRAMNAETVLDRARLGGNYLDATLMPETSEVLLPPATRRLSDNVRVEGITIEGASQTLDGMRWKNVTFVAMRLRYEGGEVSLEDVKFVHCRFGFTTDERGAKLADAIALGKTSIEIQ